MKKSGQLTIFVIIAIVIIGGILIFYSFRHSIVGEKIPASIEPVYNNFLSCFEEKVDEGIYYIALHGGYYNVPNETSLVYFIGDIPYYYLNSKDYIPAMSLIEKELAEYISDNLELCFDLNSLRGQGVEINIKNYSVLVDINEDKTKINMINLLTIRKGEDVKQFKEIEVNFNYNIEKLYVTSGEIVKSYKEKPGFLCLTCLEELSYKNNVNIKVAPIADVFALEDNITLFSIEDKEYMSENKLTWVFVVE